MKRALLVSLLFMSSIYGISQEYYLVNHIAEEGWTTTVTLYNDGLNDQTVTLRYWHDPAGPETTFTGLVIPADGSAAFDNSLFGYDGVAQIEAQEDSMIRVKLSYRYGTSHSLAEFILPNTYPTHPDETRWAIPNPSLAHMDWMGLAVANFNTATAHVTVKAYKNSVEVGTTNLDVAPYEKVVDVSSGFWPGLNYPDIDMITVTSDITIPPPMAIIGNTAQDRHLFFLGSTYSNGIFDYSQKHYIPHVAESNWHTTITAMNTSGTPETLTLNSWHSDGSVDQENALFTVPAYGFLALTAGTDFAYEGTATVRVLSTVIVKLSYQYQDSQSISDFILSGSGEREWLLPNSTHEWFQWFGIAVASSAEETAVAIDAYKNGVLLGTFSRKLSPHTKYVALASDIWPGLDYSDIDMVLVRSDKTIQAPISITGNTTQDRHVFFQGASMFLNNDRGSQVWDEAFDAYLLANFDTDHDGTLSVSEWDAVTEIDTGVNNPWHGKIRDLTGISNFSNLITLICKDENLSWLPNMNGMSSLQTLNASNNKIVRIDSFDPLVDLQYLHLDNNQLETIPDVSGMFWLSQLWVRSNRLSEVPGITSLTFLEVALLSHNQFTSLPDLTASANLIKLHFSENQIDSIYDLSVLSHLQKLDCSSNNLTSIPGLSSFTSLEEFLCSYNQIPSLDGLSSLTSLTWVECSGNPLASLPDLSGNTQLNGLACSNTNVSVIPGLSTLSHMGYLYCDHTDISDLSGISGLTELQLLGAQNTLITSLPDMSALTQLKYLWLYNCLLTDIPDVTHNTLLQEFHCWGNYFGPDDCSRIQAISAMGIPYFNYNPQHDGSTLTCP